MRKGIRKRIWDQGTEISQTDVAEFARDVDGAVRSIPDFQILVTDTTWAFPFFLGCDHVPQGLLVIRVETPNAPTVGVAYFPDPKWEADGSRLKITRADGFSPGTRYRVTWMVIG